ncbi:MAG: hypothetical protein QOK17_1282 [Sphingomonadales bacterium]|nr:hypothetical protein [Sphingomonadales bacterium]
MAKRRGRARRSAVRVESSATLAARKRARARWSEALGERYLALLGETGNLRRAAEAAGAPWLFDNRRRSDPAFAARCRAVLDAVDARLKGADNAFPHAPAPRAAPLPAGAEGDPGGALKPGRKRRQARPEPTIRIGMHNRAQIVLSRDGHWTADIEADFLARLRLTGNFDASARAVGFQPCSVARRLEKWPAFKRDCDEAYEVADVHLRYRLVSHAHALTRGPGEARPEGEEDVPFDPKGAMQIIGFLDARKDGGLRRRRKGLPDKTFDEAVESVLAKIEAIERHEELIAKEREGGE